MKFMKWTVRNVACISASSVSEKASLISIKFRIRRTALKVSREYIFFFFWSDIMSALHGDQIAIHGFPSTIVHGINNK